MKKSMLFLVVVGFLQNPFMGFSQDSIPNSSNLKEGNFLKFQDHFFKALAQKSIYNYRVAIQNLEKCNELKPNDISVFFELSKNYLMLKKFFEAEEFALQALAIEPNNYWVLRHLSRLYVASSNIRKAIPIQEKLAAINQKESEKLVYLYFQNNQREKATGLLSALEQRQLLTPGLVRFKNRFLKAKTKTASEKTKGLAELIQEFEVNKSYQSLYKTLTLSAKTNTKILLTYSEIGLELFPAQAFVYLMNAKAHNKNNNYKKALDQLLNGIDFVVDDTKLAADFYDEIAKSYTGLGNKPAAIKNKNKALELRKK
mgnify:CR=1 FL=1